MLLTEVKQAKARDKPYTMADGNGLILEVRHSGAKYWIVRYWEKGEELSRGENEANLALMRQLDELHMKYPA